MITQFIVFDMKTVYRMYQRRLHLNKLNILLNNGLNLYFTYSSKKQRFELSQNTALILFRSDKFFY